MHRLPEREPANNAAATQRRLNISRVTGCSLMFSIGIHSQEMLFRRRSGRVRRLQLYPSDLPLPKSAIRLSVPFRRLSIFLPGTYVNYHYSYNRKINQ